MLDNDSVFALVYVKLEWSATSSEATVVRVFYMGEEKTKNKNK